MNSARLPRLKQPLFTKQAEGYVKASDDNLLARLIIAYDALWTLRYSPNDIAFTDAIANAEAGLHNLGGILEHAIGTDIFDTDPKQLSFPEEVLNPRAQE